MPRQFRLRSLFLLTAVVAVGCCWAKVAVPYWLRVYPSRKKLESDLQSFFAQSPTIDEGRTMLYGVTVLTIALALAAILAIGLALYHRARRQVQDATSSARLPTD
jgi:hypothetical protein